MTDLNKITENAHKAVAELRETVESKFADLGEGKERISKIEKDLDSYESANQKLVKQIQEQKAAMEQMEEKYNFLESNYASIPAAGVDAKAIDEQHKMEMKALESYFKYGNKRDFDLQQKYLRTDSNTNGGFLVPVEFVRDIIKDITEVSPVRQVAMVRQAQSKSMEQPIRTGLLTAGWVGEGDTGTEANSTYGSRMIHVKKIFVQVQITPEELQDAAFDMEQEIRSDVTERFAQVEGAGFTKGTGVNQPIGFMSAPDVPEINSGVANDITADNFYDLEANLKSGYLSNSIYGLNRFTIGRVRRLKASGNGEYLWSPGNLAAGVPNAIAGYPYVEMPDLDSIAANNFPVIFADFRRFYQIADRMSLEVVRDDVTKALEGKILFNYFLRVGGDVRQPEAGVKLKVAV